MARVITHGVPVLALLLALLPAVPASGQVLCRSEADDVAALSRFNRAVTAYVELHRLLDPRLSPLYICSDVEAIAGAVDELAEAIAAERAEALPGDVFSPEVADLFRARLMRIDPAARPSLDVAGLEGEEGSAPLPAVNARFVWDGSVAPGEAVARALPALPLELAYRFVGRALVLVDVRANLVVDVLAEALP
jgi:hypothetical protein